jgi:thioredoxin 1
MAKQVIKFYADWCGPCKIYGPTFDRVKEDLQDIIEFKEINVEQDTENLSGEYKVKGIPMTILLEDGEVIKSKSGRMGEIELREFILN